MTIQYTCLFGLFDRMFILTFRGDQVLWRALEEGNIGAQQQPGPAHEPTHRNSKLISGCGSIVQLQSCVIMTTLSSIHYSCRSRDQVGQHSPVWRHSVHYVTPHVLFQYNVQQYWYTGALWVGGPGLEVCLQCLHWETYREERLRREQSPVMSAPALGSEVMDSHPHYHCNIEMEL